MRTLLLSLSLIALLSPPALADSAVQRIVPRGMDGGIFYYQVRCADGQWVSFEVHDESGRTCVYRRGREEPECSMAWNIPEAAEAACS
jgi:hypothetical protein